MKFLRTLSLLFIPIALSAQNTTSTLPISASMFKDVSFQNIGPTIMSGRVVDLAVNPNNASEFYVAYASGGLWYTNTNGISFEPVMDSATVINCGSVTVDWKSGTIWVGTGEVNASRSSYAGVGVLKSVDKGKTWEHLGLSDSHHICRLLVNPENPNEITVGVTGHLYTNSEARGIFKTTDGGKTWNKTLFVNDTTGVIDLVESPTSPKIQYASVWEKDRKAWDFKGSGKSSAIYKSTDGGDTWTRITQGDNGFPSHEGVGRIGLAFYNDIIGYAVVDNQNPRPNTQKAAPKDANAALFETEVIGAEVYKTVDGGKNWNRTHEKFLDDLYYTYGYYFGNIGLDVKNPDHFIIGGVPLLETHDGGKTFKNIDKENVHADHHVVWVNPSNPKHIINGNDGGVNISYDSGKTWMKCNNQAVGQFYAINVDEQEPYHVYGGLQDNGVWIGSSTYEPSREWQQEGKYPYTFLLGGDGMQVQIDKRNPNIVITGSQFGNYFRIDRSTNQRKWITPKHKKEEKPYRFNWQTPILLSSHNQDILYLGSNFLHRSMNQGETWEIISPDLTQGAKKGNVAFGTITTVAESTLQFGLLYVGSDDGLLHLSKDGGATWSRVSEALPQNYWVSRVVASTHHKARVYVTLNGYRKDDFKAMLYQSDDFGQTWKAIMSNLPNSAVNVVVEDPKNENVLFVGTDNGLYASLDGGKNWFDFSEGMPNVAVHDLKIQKKANDLVVGTHGRSIYKVNIEKIQALTAENLQKELLLFDLPSIQKDKQWGNSWSVWAESYIPEVALWFYSNTDRKVQLDLYNGFGQKIVQKEINAHRGLNKVTYDMSLDEEAVKKWVKKEPKIALKPAKNGKYYLPASKNKWVMTSGEIKVEKEFLVKETNSETTANQD